MSQEGDRTESSSAPLPTSDKSDDNTASTTNNASSLEVKEQPSRERTRSPRPQLSATLSQSFSESGDAIPSARAHGGSIGALSPDIPDRVFPIRSVVSRDPNPTPTHRSEKNDGYFSGTTSRRFSGTNSSSAISAPQTPARASIDRGRSGRVAPGDSENTLDQRRSISLSRNEQDNQSKSRQSMENRDELTTSKPESEVHDSLPEDGRSSVRSIRSTQDDFGTGLVTARFRHVVTEGGHMVITGRGGETLQRCEDEPIHIPGAVQGFGLLIALEEESEGKFTVRIVSENSTRMIGYTPRQLFALESFTDILTEEQADNLLDHVDFIRDDDADVAVNGPEVFTMSIRSPTKKMQKLWCAMHINDKNPGLIICEFELEDDPKYPLVPNNDATPEPPEDTLDSDPTPQEYAESTQNISRPLRVLRSARKRKGEAAAMEVFNIMSQVQEQLAAAPNLETFLKVLCGVVKELTGFHRVMVYQFDSAWNGRVVTELVDPRATKDLYKGLNFPASDIPKQARDLYKINRVRMLYDRDQETARLVCRTMTDLETPLDLTYSYLRAMSPIHIKYLANMAVRSSMSISINSFGELWGLIACHSYGSRGMRVSFPIRKMCRLVGDSASRNIERLSYASRLQARKLINTVPTQSNPSGYIIASSEDLLKLFDADYGLLSIRDETKVLGQLEQSQEALAMLEYLRMRKVTGVITSQDIREDFPDLRYAPGFKCLAGLLLVPLSASGQDFIVFFRRGQLREVKWAGNPYEKFIKEGTEGYLEPRKSFKTWSEKVVGKCRDWTEEEIETAAVLCLVYGKFIEVWRQKEAALQNSQLTRLLLANSAHEVRTPLNAIINYLEIALEGKLDQETRDNLSKSHSASKSLIYVINDLLDLTKTEEGVGLVKDEAFDLHATIDEATDSYRGDAKRKQISYDVIKQPGLPKEVIGDQRKIRQAISNITANAIQHTTSGGVTVEAQVVSQTDDQVEVEVRVSDTGSGIPSKRLDALFRELEQVQSEGDLLVDNPQPEQKAIDARLPKEGEKRVLGLGLAVVARTIRNMNGQMRLKSEEGQGTRFVLSFPFAIPDASAQPPSSAGSQTPHAERDAGMSREDGEVTVIQRDFTRRGSNGKATSLSRKGSADSVHSKNSLTSMLSSKSGVSQNSQRSEADRLIDAISEPHMVGAANKQSRPSSSGVVRPVLPRGSSTTSVADGLHARQRSLSADAPVPEHTRLISIGPVGYANVPDQRTPIRSVRVQAGADLESSPAMDTSSRRLSTSERSIESTKSTKSIESEPNGKVDAMNMHVLVAEDDPINSKIIKKRLEKLGHQIQLTVNGEECASAYGEKSGHYDVVLMDMQMPIVDGLTSTKMIRSFEKSHPTHMLSTRATLNGRVPIIAVSASLLERERQMYIDAGFDGWILKPVSFDRLSEIMKGIVDKDARKSSLYRPGTWERGGWFDEGQKDVFTAGTRPDDKLPGSGMSEGARIAAAADDAVTKEDNDSRQTQEQERLLRHQAEKRRENPNTAGKIDSGVQRDE